MIAHRRALKPLVEARGESLFLLQPNHAFAADALSLLAQVFVDARAPVPPLAAVKRRADQHRQLAVTLRVSRLRPALPRVEAAARHPQTAAQQAERVVRLLRRDESESHRRSVAKKAAAFFRISRSSRRIRFSLRRRAGSSRSAVVSPVLPCVRSARACVTHLRSAVSVRSRSRATCPRSCLRRARAGPLAR